MRQVIAGAFLALAGCWAGPSDWKIENVSGVEAYFVRCDTALTLGACHGSRHRHSTMTFTVIVSTQTVIPQGIYSYHACTVRGARSWQCLDAENEAIWMQDGLLTWQTPPVDRIAATRTEYCETPAPMSKEVGAWESFFCKR